MLEHDLSALPADRLAHIIATASAELAKRAGVQTPPVQLDLIPPPAPIDPAEIDIDERLEGGRKRWMLVKEATRYIPLSEDTLIARAKRDGIGIQLGGPRGKWLLDMTRIASRA